jgi:hypothetical protein
VPHNLTVQSLHRLAFFETKVSLNPTVLIFNTHPELNLPSPAFGKFAIS